MHFEYKHRTQYPLLAATSQLSLPACRLPGQLVRGRFATRSSAQSAQVCAEVLWKVLDIPAQLAPREGLRYISYDGMRSLYFADNGTCSGA